MKLLCEKKSRGELTRLHNLRPVPDMVSSDEVEKRKS